MRHSIPSSSRNKVLHPPTSSSVVCSGYVKSRITNIKMHLSFFLLTSLLGLALSSPVPQRASPVIGVVIPSEFAGGASAMFGMGAAVERSAPSPVTSSSSSSSATSTAKRVTAQVLSAGLSAPMTTVTTSSVNPLKPGNRYVAFGNAVPSNATPVAGMGEPMSRSRNGKIS